MRVRFFDLTEPVAMMPGMAVNRIAKTLRSKLLAAGVAEVDMGGGLPVYYVKVARFTHEAESLWLDDGDSSVCVAYNIHSTPDHEWVKTEIGRASGYDIPISAAEEIVGVPEGGQR